MTVTDPSVPVFPAGYGPLPADMNNWIQAPFTFLTSKVVFRAENHATTTLTGGTFVKIPFNTILEDPYSGWNATSHVWDCPDGCSGLYEVSMTAITSNPGNSTSVVLPIIYLNGAEYLEMGEDWLANGATSGSCGGAPVPLVGGVDNIGGYIYTTTTVTTENTAGQYTTMEITWLCL